MFLLLFSSTGIIAYTRDDSGGSLGQWLITENIHVFSNTILETCPRRSFKFVCGANATEWKPTEKEVLNPRRKESCQPDHRPQSFFRIIRTELLLNCRFAALDASFVEVNNTLGAAPSSFRTWAAELGFDRTIECSPVCSSSIAGRRVQLTLEDHDRLWHAGTPVLKFANVSMVCDE